MTDRLFYEDASLLRFSALITGIEDDGRRVYLDRSAFYPTSGGQPFDTGLLGGVAVIDVVEEGARVAHLLADPIGVPVDSMVVGQLDADRRFDHMQQHTGQHLVSALCADRYGWVTRSVHFGNRYVTVDVAATAVSVAVLDAIETSVNALLVQNLPVEAVEKASTRGA